MGLLPAAAAEREWEELPLESSRPVRWGGSGGSNEPTRSSGSSTSFARLAALTFRGEKVCASAASAL